MRVPGTLRFASGRGDNWAAFGMFMLIDCLFVTCFRLIGGLLPLCWPASRIPLPAPLALAVASATGRRNDFWRQGAALATLGGCAVAAADGPAVL